jgi:hypothetical protein
MIAGAEFIAAAASPPARTPRRVVVIVDPLCHFWRCTN